MRGKVLVLAMVLAGCGNQKATSPMADGSLNIMNGKTVTALNNYSRHTVFIQTQTDTGSGVCTGSIYDSQTILTAAHCLVGASEAVIIFATNIRDPNLVTPEQVRFVDVATVYPSFKPEREGKPEEAPTPSPDAAPPIAKIPTVDELAQSLEEANVVMDDVALLHFSGGLAAGYAPVKLVSSEAQSQPGAKLHMIGYGLARVDSKMKVVDGKARFVAMPDRTTTGLLRETEIAIAKYSTKTKLILTSGTETSVCSGDSGGPAFVTDPANGEVVQAGIAEAVANEYCNSVSMHTAIFPYLNWIKETAAKLAEQAAQATPSS